MKNPKMLFSVIPGDPADRLGGKTAKEGKDLFYDQVLAVVDIQSVFRLKRVVSTKWGVVGEVNLQLSPAFLGQSPPGAPAKQVYPANTLLRSPRNSPPTNRSHSCDLRFAAARFLSTCRVPQSTKANNWYQEEFS